MLVRCHFRGALQGTLMLSQWEAGPPWGFPLPGVPRGRCSHAALCPGKAVSGAAALGLAQVLGGCSREPFAGRFWGSCR